MQWKLSVISPISSTVLGFQVVVAVGVWEGRDLEDAMAFGQNGLQDEIADG